MDSSTHRAIRWRRMTRIVRLLILGCGILTAQEIELRSIQYGDLPLAMQQILAAEGLNGDTWQSWLDRYDRRKKQRLAEGVVEHIVYFAMQSQKLSKTPPIAPGKAAASDSDKAAAQLRLEEFFSRLPVDERHVLLREMHSGTEGNWPLEKMLSHTLAFLREKQSASTPDENRLLYQHRGLSEDSFPESMEAVRAAIEWLKSRSGQRHPTRVLLVGPGMELGSRFGLQEDAPIAGPQAESVRKSLLYSKARVDCADIRPEVREVFTGSPCRGFPMDIVTTRTERPLYDLAIATNVLVYLPETELALAVANLVASLRPGGCLIHNEERFAVRAFGDITGASLANFITVTYRSRSGGLAIDRAVIQCKAAE